jgi:hypothetical protein
VIDFAIDEDSSSETFGDVYLGDTGDLAAVEATDAIDQAVRIGLRTYKREWFLDENAGIDYFNVVFAKGLTPTQKAAEIKTQILSSPGIIGLEQFSMELDGATRVATLEFRAVSEDGTTTEFSETV